MKKLIFLTFLCSFSLFSSAQQVISSSGGSFSKNNLQISWTIGESIIETCKSDYCILTQGMHQSKLHSPNNETNLLEIDLYPNPTIDDVQLVVKSTIEKKIEYHLYESNGNILSTGKFSNNRAKIPMQKYAPSIYYVGIFHNNIKVKSLKVIKMKY